MSVLPTFRTEIRVAKGWDKRDADPKKNYGVHGVELTFALHGPAGTITWTIYTGWVPRSVAGERKLSPRTADLFPSPAGLNYHSPVPRHDWSTLSTTDCLYTGGECYMDGTSLTDDAYWLLVEEGEDAVWAHLAGYYDAWLGPCDGRTVASLRAMHEGSRFIGVGA